MSQNPEIIKEKIDNFEHMGIINDCLAKQTKNQHCYKQRQIANDECEK